MTDPVQPDAPTDPPVDPAQPALTPPALPTQVKYPLQAVLRTFIQTLPMIAVLITVIVDAVQKTKPEWVVVWGPTAIAISGIITRIMQNETVNEFLTQIGLGARPKAVGK